MRTPLFARFKSIFAPLVCCDLLLIKTRNRVLWFVLKMDQIFYINIFDKTHLKNAKVSWGPVHR